MEKEAAYNKQDTKAAKANWNKKLRGATGRGSKGNDFLITDEILFDALGPVWTEVLKKAIEVGATNILAITSKSLRKTAIVKFVQHYLLSRHQWLDAQDLRRTKDQSSSVLIKSHLDALTFWATEYNLPWLREVIQQASFKMYFVRDKKRKDNQEIEFSSFEAMRKIGGFTKAYVFHWEELVDPDSKGQAPTIDEFMYTYNLVREKNEENFRAKGQMDVYRNTPTNFFTMNRWDTDHPLVEFAERHAPWQPVKEWMLEDPENNNFFMHYVDEVGEEDEFYGLGKTLIVYGSKLANHIFAKDEEWKRKQISLIETGVPSILGTVLGDVFEGTTSVEKAYHYNTVNTVSRDEFKESYAKNATKAYISIDLDFSRQIRIRPKYLVSKQFVGGNISRFIRDRAYRIKCNGVSSDGASTEFYFQETKKKLMEICKQIREEMPHLTRVHLLFDDKKAQWVGRFNFGDAKNPYWIARKVDFDQKWRIYERPKTMDLAQDTGFMVDIEHETNDNLHKYLKNVIIDKGSQTNDKKIQKKKRLEKDRDAMVDDMNSDEYPLYLERASMALNIKATRLLSGENKW